MAYEDLIQQSAKQYGIDPRLLTAVIGTESNFNPQAKNAETGASGLGQMLSATAASLGVKDPTDPKQAIPGAARLLAENIQRFGVDDGVRAYHGGTDRANWGPKTEAYVNKVSAAFKGGSPSSGLLSEFDSTPTSTKGGASFANVQSGSQSTAPPAGSTGLLSEFDQTPTQATASQQAASPAQVTAPAGGSSMPGAIQDIRQWVAEHHLGGPIEDFYGAAAHNLAKPLHGLAQLVGHGAAGGVNLVAPGSSAAQAVNQAMGNYDTSLNNWENDYQAATPNNAASIVGAGGGQMIPLMAGGAGQKLAQAGDYLANAIPKLPQAIAPYLSAAGQGAALGAIQPVTDGSGSFLSDKLHQMEVGAATGGVLRGVGGAINTLRQAAQPLMDPIGYARENWLPRLVGDKADQVITNLRGAPEFVPGSVPTTAQSGGIPELVMAEKTLGNQFPSFKTALADRSNQSNDARIALVRSLAGTPAETDAAYAARTAATKPFYEQLATSGNPVQVQPVMDALESLSNSSLGQRPVIAKTISSLQSTIGQKAKDGNINPDILDGLRQNIGEIMRDNAPNGAVGSQVGKALDPIKDQIAQAIERSNPGYIDNVANYARLSQPITDTQPAARLLDVLDSRRLASSGQPQLNLSDINATLKSAAKADYQPSPQTLAQLKAIQDDLQRESISNALRYSGSDTAANLAANNWLTKSLYGSNFGGTGVMPRLVGAAIGGATTPLIGAAGGYLGVGKLGQFGADRVGKAAADLMMNPKLMADQLEILQKSNPEAAQALQRLLMQEGASQSAEKIPSQAQREAIVRRLNSPGEK